MPETVRLSILRKPQGIGCWYTTALLYYVLYFLTSRIPLPNSPPSTILCLTDPPPMAINLSLSYLMDMAPYLYLCLPFSATDTVLLKYCSSTAQSQSLALVVTPQNPLQFNLMAAGNTQTLLKTMIQTLNKHWLLV